MRAELCSHYYLNSSSAAARGEAPQQKQARWSGGRFEFTGAARCASYPSGSACGGREDLRARPETPEVAEDVALPGISGYRLLRRARHPRTLAVVPEQTGGRPTAPRAVRPLEELLH